MSGYIEAVWARQLIGGLAPKIRKAFPPACSACQQDPMGCSYIQYPQDAPRFYMCAYPLR